MKTLLGMIAAGLLLLGSTTCGADRPPPARAGLSTSPPDAGWQRCQASAECAATWLSCHGWAPVNAAHEQAAQAWYRSANSDFLSRAECEGPSAVPPVASCRRQRCELQAATQ